MTIQEQIIKDLRDAMLSKDNNLRDFLRVVISEFSRFGKALSDDQAKKELSKLRENAKIMSNDYELNVISKYLPNKLSEDETRGIVTDIVKANNIESIKEMGKFMGILKLFPQASLIDNAIASTIFKELVS
jgi:uncharacterized protein YqeY